MHTLKTWLSDLYVASNLGLHCLKIRIKILIFNLLDLMTMVVVKILYKAFHHIMKLETVPRFQHILLVPFTNQGPVA